MRDLHFYHGAHTAHKNYSGSTSGTVLTGGISQTVMCNVGVRVTHSEAAGRFLSEGKVFTVQND